MVSESCRLCWAVRGCGCLSLLQVNDCSGRGWSMMTSRSGPGTTQGRQGRGAKFVLILTVSWQSPTRLEGDNTRSRSVTVSRRVVARCHSQTVSSILLRERTSKQCISMLRAMSLYLNINSSRVSTLRYHQTMSS